MRSKLDCTVCYNLIENEVKMCPQCSALFCDKCIDRLKTDQCPNCRAKVRKSMYVRNRLAEEIIKETIFKKHLTCQEHDLDKIYFCETCKKPSCPECWFGEHIGHERKILKKVYEEKK